VDGYSDPAQPSTNPPELHATYVNGSWAVLSPNTSDWRFVGLKVTSTGHSGIYDATRPRYPGGIYFGGSNNLISRVELKELGTGGVYFSGVNNAIFECELHVFSRAGFYSSGTAADNYGNSVIGNYLHDMQCDYAEHGYRMQGGSKFFLGFNVFEADGSKDAIEIRGDSDYIILYGNVLDRSSGLHPQNRASPPVEYIHHCVVDSNIFIGRTDPAYNNGFTVRATAVAVGAKDIVVRNNIVDNYDNPFTIEDDRPNIDVSTRIRLENNTVVTPTVGCTFDVQPNAHTVKLVKKLL